MDETVFLREGMLLLEPDGVWSTKRRELWEDPREQLIEEQGTADRMKIFWAATPGKQTARDAMIDEATRLVCNRKADGCSVLFFIFYFF